LSEQVDRLSDGLQTRNAELEQQGKHNFTRMQQTVDSVFLSDDKLLSSLQKLGWELEPEDPQERQNIERLRGICAR
jgi:hypothetical protein